MQPAASFPPPPTDLSEDTARPTVLDLLERVRAAQRSQLRRRALLWACALILGLTGTALLIAPLSPALGRVILCLSLLAPIAAWFAYARVGVATQVGDLFRTARWVGQRIPELSLHLLGGVELEQELAKKPDFSSSLARAHLRILATRAQDAALEQLVDVTPVRRARRILWALSLAWPVLLLVAPNRVGLGVAALRPHPRSIALAERTPITGEVELSYRYPAYTGLAPRTVPGTNGEVSAPAGTEIQLKTRSDRGVARAGLVLNTKPLPLRVTGGRELSGSFVAQESGSYRFVFYSSGGRVLAEGPEIAVQVEPDAPPTVTLLTPAQEVEVRPEERLTLKYQAQDDYGLSSLELVYSRQGQEKRIRLPLEDRRRSSGQYTWDLKGLDLQEGERVTYALEARDNNSTKPQGATSRPHVLKVYSATEHQREALVRTEAFWERLVRQLGDRLEGPDRVTSKNPDAIAGAAMVDEAGWTLVREAAELSSDFRRERDAPAGLAGALAHVGESVRDRLRETGDARRDFVRNVRMGRAGLASERLSNAVQEEIGELERDVVYLESLLQRHKVEQLRALARKVDNERRQLASRLEEYRKTKDPATQKALLSEIHEMRQRLSELMRQMAELARGLPDEHLSPEALAEQSRDLGAQLDRLEELVRQGKAEDALAELQKLTQEMNEMQRDLDQNSGGPTDPQLSADLRAFRKELQETTDAQQQLAERTKAIRDRYREQRRQHLAQRADKLREQLLKEATALSKDYREIPPNAIAYPGESGRGLEEVRSELENLEGALKAEDFDLAAEAAERTRRSSQGLAVMGQLQEQRDNYMGAPPEARVQSRDLARHLESNAQRVQQIEKQLSELFPPSGQMMSETDRQSLKGMAPGQRELGKRAEGLRRRMSQLQERAPIFGQDAQEQMRTVGEQMSEAQGQLDGQEPGRAHSQQRAALEGLQQFAQRLDDAQKQGGQGGMPMPMGDRESGGFDEGARELSREKVEIPDADDSKAPREFRKDLLEAMKQGVPERYREQVKHYYEELVR